ncbi:MAG: Gldg family protein [Kiloniellales bacterium]
MARRKEGFYARIAIVLLVLLFLFSVGLADRLLGHLRLDLTEDQRFTLSPVTEEILQGLDEPLQLRLFVSSRFTDINPAYASYAERIAGLLDEMARAAEGRLLVERLDPLPFSAAEDLALAEGLEGLPLSGRPDERFYLGLSGRNSVDQQDLIPFFPLQRAATLEYELAALVASLAQPRKPTVGLATSLPLDGNAILRQPPQAILGLLEPLVELVEVDLEQGYLPAELEVLMLIQPNGLSPVAAYALDQFVMRGGRLLAFIDPFSEQQALMDRQRRLPPTPPDFSAMAPLLQAWGLTLPSDTVVADRLSARRVQVGSAGRQSTIDYIVWLSVPAARMDREDPLVAHLETLNLNTAGAFLPQGEGETAVSALAWSSAQAEQILIERMAVNPDPTALLADYKPGGRELTLAARIRGQAKTAFPQGPPEGWLEAIGADGQTVRIGHLSSAQQDLDLILLADSDLLFNAAWIGAGEDGGPAPVAGNGDLVVNALEALTGSAPLASLRGRSLTQRPFTLIEEMRREAELVAARREQALIRKIDSVQGEIGEIEESLDGGLALNAAQRETLEQLRGELQQAEVDLRANQRGLREDLDRLILDIQLANILAVPLLLALIGGLVMIWRRRRALGGAQRLRG